MKLLLSNHCFKCDTLEQTYPSIPEQIAIELNETGLYSFVCPNGHTNYIFIQQHLFQILFDMGILSLSDSFTREAVSSFSGALERFYEFVIKLILLNDGLPEGEIEKNFNKIIKQSERQLGAYILLYFQKFKSEPLLISDNSEFRNLVIHQGKIPSEQETTEYGQEVANIIVNTLLELKKFYKEEINNAIQKVYSYNVNIIKKKQKEVKGGSLSFPTAIEVRSKNLEDLKLVSIKEKITGFSARMKQGKLPYIK